ncbi:MAG: DUF5340 domain-containing protein [Spirulinaceae cyanobacterium]
MEPIPLPSHVHYELLLQLLERQSSFAANENPAVKKQVQQLIILIRKALAQQKQIESTCQHFDLPYESRWSLNHTVSRREELLEVIPLPEKRNNVG